MERVKKVKTLTVKLDTPAQRRWAKRDLIWADHGFLRARFQNFHWVSEEMARANQPSPSQIAAYADMGFKTIVNLRGLSDTGYYALEKEACTQNGIELVDLRMFSREPPKRETVLEAKRLFETIAYPALMHCKSGADRAGIGAALFLHFHKGVPIEQAREQLSLRYLHVRQGKTGMLDHFFERYLAHAATFGKTFLQWVEEDYDYKAVKASFMSSWWGNLLVDNILRRE
jgi:protein tyrosine/serine phosphatase